MSCNHCDTKFNFFHKELGCSNCGLSFCNKCLKQKCHIPSKGSGEYNVCRVCYSKLTSGTNENEVILPPDRFLKRLENLENPAAPPITVYRQDPKISALKSGLSIADQELVDRLEKLKQKKKLPPSDSEIRERLAKLKGESFDSSSDSKKHVFLPDTRSDQEKADALLQQYTSETEIQTSHESHDDLAQRLSTLKGEEYKKNNPDLDDEPDSEEEIERINKKITAEVSLDQKCQLDGSGKPTEDEDDEFRPSSPELPWCVLCNGDARYRCLDCGGDLYCSSCNTEVHKTWGDTDHRVVPYEPK